MAMAAPGGVQAMGSYILLQRVPYGQSGSWTISMWIKPADRSGNYFQYLLSHSTGDNVAWDANQVTSSPSISPWSRMKPADARC